MDPFRGSYLDLLNNEYNEYFHCMSPQIFQGLVDNHTSRHKLKGFYNRQKAEEIIGFLRNSATSPRHKYKKKFSLNDNGDLILLESGKKVLLAEDLFSVCRS